MTKNMEILASRMLLRPADYDRSLRFYRDELGLAIARDWAGSREILCCAVVGAATVSTHGKRSIGTSYTSYSSSRRTQ